ncbi:RNA-binding KH domain-containing protein RCF3 [Citrus sinensis]|nr:RNA-binding KH domain-containing protein RCF3 [Citrus sinensis]
MDSSADLRRRRCMRDFSDKLSVRGGGFGRERKTPYTRAMDRSRSKRNYYYDHQDYDGDTMGRTKPRYNHYYQPNNNYRHRGNNNNNTNNIMNNNTSINNSNNRANSNPKDPSLMVTTTYRILCHDMKAGGVIGKSGSIIKSIRQHTGAWINVHELIPGDEERIIEISDTRRRDPEGRMPSFSPAQEALFLIHDRILESDGGGGFYGEEEEEYGGGGGVGGGGFRGGGNRVATRMVVSRMHVGCLLGKGGKIIEQMRMETKTQIRILPRDHSLPRCVSMSEEIVQIIEMSAHMASMLTLDEEERARRLVYALLWRYTFMDWFCFIDMWAIKFLTAYLVLDLVEFCALPIMMPGRLFEFINLDVYNIVRICYLQYAGVVGDINNVKNAVAIISSRLRESQHRDRSHFHGRLHSPDRFFPDDDYVPHMNNTARRPSMDGARFSGSNYRSNNYGPRPSGYSIEAGAAPMSDSVQPFYGEDLVFRMLCPIDKVGRVIGESEGIVELLQNEIGVDLKVADPVDGSDEQIITISSEEGPDDELFPAQEALLHIQTRIVDLGADKDNIITTRLLVPSSEIGCLEGRDGSLSEMRRSTGANIQILSREEVPACVSGTDELVQIVGEIQAARDALVEVTTRLRSYLYRDFFQKETPPSSTGPTGSALVVEAASPIDITPAREVQTVTDPPAATHQSVQIPATSQPSREAAGSVSETVKQNESERREDVPTVINRVPLPLVTRSTLEVVLPDYAVPKLITKSKTLLTRFSEMSGASVSLVEGQPEGTQKIIQISGTPEQVERAQSVLQGFILSRL